MSFLCSRRVSVSMLFPYISRISVIRHTAVILRAPIARRSLATLADEVRSDASFHIPVVDFSKFRNAKSAAEKEDTSSEIVAAFKEVCYACMPYVRGAWSQRLARSGSSTSKITESRRASYAMSFRRYLCWPLRLR